MFSRFRKAQKYRNLTFINIEYIYFLMLHNHRQLYIIINVCSALSLRGSKNESNVHASIHRVIGIRCFCCCHGNSWNRLPGEKTNQISVWVENNHICICTYKFREKVDPGSNEKLIVTPPPPKKKIIAIDMYTKWKINCSDTETQLMFICTSWILNRKMHID